MKTNVVKMLWPPSISGHKGDVPPIKQLSTAKAHLRILRPPLDINDRICTHGLLLCFYITSVELAWHILRDHLCISALWCYFLVQNACWTQPPFSAHMFAYYDGRPRANKLVMRDEETFTGFFTRNGSWNGNGKVLLIERIFLFLIDFDNCE
jgi:hypothetical protein